MVVYDDFRGKIELNCPSQNTILVTTEPSSIKTYETNYTKQFGYVLSGQEDWALKHPGKIHSQPALFWYYGANRLSYDEIAHNPPLEKNNLISTVTSNKKQKHTRHYQRDKFINELQAILPKLDRFGRGIREIDDKAEALDSYKYHIAVENHICDHWWTEKLADSFLGLTLPFYSGAPNAADYFPFKSFIPVNINNPKETAKIIQHAVENKEYEKRLPYIQEARRRVFAKIFFYATISKIIQRENLRITQNVEFNTECKYTVLKSRKSLRENPIIAISVLFEKLENKISSFISKYREKVINE